MPKYWLLKSEPAKYSWDQMVKDKRTHWDGVRNFQAANNLRALKQGDRAFFYHSNEGKDIVGIVEIARAFYPDPGDPSGKFGMVDVAPVMPVKTPVSLAEMKQVPELSGFSLLRQSRLSVCPVSDKEWAVICKMAGIDRIIGYERDGRGFLLDDKLLPVKERGKFIPTPIVKYYMGIARGS
mgnify:CR=1 FL=1